MAFTTPPTFVDGDILSASQLNILAENQNYLSGLASSTNIGFAERLLTTTANEAEYHIVHVHDYLHVRFNLPNTDVDLDVYYDATNVAAYDSDIEGAGDHEKNVDLSGAGLTVGQRYTLKFVRPTPAEGGDTGTVTLYWAGEVSEEL